MQPAVVASSIGDTSRDVLGGLGVGVGVVLVAVGALSVLALIVFTLGDHIAGILGGVVLAGLGALVGGALTDSREGLVVGGILGVLVAIAYCLRVNRRTGASARKPPPSSYDPGYDRW